MADETSDRVPTGIPGLDDMLEGGLQRDGIYLLAGDTGAGKTIFSSQFLYVGAVKYDQPGVMISLEERSEDIRRNLTKFGWNFEKLEEYGKIVVADIPRFRKLVATDKETTSGGLMTFEQLQKFIKMCVDATNAKRLVVDSLTAIGILYESKSHFRQDLFRFFEFIRDLGCTTLVTTELLEASTGISRFDCEEFLAQGVIVIRYQKAAGDYRRTVTIRKMRGTNHGSKVSPLDISPDGMVVHPEEKVYE